MTAWLGLSGWESLVILLAAVGSVTLLLMIVLTRSPLRHHLRVGFFVERDHQSRADAIASEPLEPEPIEPPEEEETTWHAPRS